MSTLDGSTADLRSGRLELSDFYFAYGPDMDPAVLSAHGGNPELAGVARLADHRLAFFGRTEIWDSGMETVIEAPGEEVWGVLYRMAALEWDRWDEWMGARMDGAGMYFHYPIVVTDAHGSSHYVRMYKKDLQGAPERPSEEYLALMVNGARRQGLPREYVGRLQQIPSRKATFPVPAPGNAVRGVLRVLDCRACEEGK